jgi:3',5'-cyclic-AMP phosphodiesterase
LDAVDRAQYRMFFDLVAAYEPDIVLIGGDISNGVASLTHLKQLSKLIDKQFYFVLGNHDFYYGSIAKNREAAQQLTKENSKIFYLTDRGIIPLSEQTALIGHDGWSDGRAGNFFDSDVMLNDYFLIDELKNITPEERLAKLNQLGTEAADYVKAQLIEAFKTYERVVLLMHVPPFEESCLYEGTACDENWAPHFVGQAVGETLEDIMKKYPEKQLLVLCGHVHWGSDLEILPNLRVVTGHSELGNPNVQGLIFVN